MSIDFRARAEKLLDAVQVPDGMGNMRLELRDRIEAALRAVAEEATRNAIKADPTDEVCQCSACGRLHRRLSASVPSTIAAQIAADMRAGTARFVSCRQGGVR